MSWLQIIGVALLAPGVILVVIVIIGFVLSPHPRDGLFYLNDDDCRGHVSAKTWVDWLIAGGIVLSFATGIGILFLETA